MKAKENTANQTREGRQELSLKWILATSSLAVTGFALVMAIYTAFTRDVSEEIAVVLYLIIGVLCGIFASACILFFQALQARKDKENMLNTITGANGAVVNKLEPLDGIKTTLASIECTQKEIEGILKEINAKL